MKIPVFSVERQSPQKPRCGGKKQGGTARFGMTGKSAQASRSDKKQMHIILTPAHFTGYRKKGDRGF